ncbi:MAG TPA: hypothetical protein VJ719_14395, partial [Chthoniobacterales bacterium]|nr:hypothetical protein [Chthoniobacterales bacterium]
MQRLAIVVILSLFAGLNTAPAVLVDWGTLSWTAGSLSNSYDIDPGNAGNDITVTVSGDTAQLQPSLVTGNPATPAITRAFDGGFSPGPSTLELAANYATNAQALTVTVTFAAGYTNGVGNVSFSIFDIDFANSSGNTYQDLIRTISGTSATGASISPTITGLGSNVSLAGSGLSQTLTGTGSNVDTGASSGTGNATITFNAADVRSVTFTYGSTALFANPTYQHIGINNVTYAVVPEINP